MAVFHGHTVKMCYFSSSFSFLSIMQANCVYSNNEKGRFYQNFKVHISVAGVSKIVKDSKLVRGHTGHLVYVHYFFEIFVSKLVQYEGNLSLLNA